MGDTGAALTEMWRSVLLFVPTAIAFLAIIGIGTVIALVLRRLVTRALDRLGFDRLVRRGGLGRMLARNRYEPSDLAARLVHYGLLLVTLQVAFAVWGPNPVSALISAVVAWLPRVLVAIVIVVVSAAIASGARELVAGVLGGLSYGRTVARLTSWSIVGLGVIAALNQVGIATTVTTPVLITALATVAGVIVVGVGGGLVRPMARRWERWLDRAEADAQALRDRAQAYAAGRTDAGRRVADRHGTTGPVPASRPAAAAAAAKSRGDAGAGIAGGAGPGGAGAGQPHAASYPAGADRYGAVDTAPSAYPGGWPVLDLPAGEVGTATLYRSGHAAGRAVEPSVAEPTGAGEPATRAESARFGAPAFPGDRPQPDLPERPER